MLCPITLWVLKKTNSYKVKLGYNELGYNEENEPNWLVSLILRVQFLGYNEQNPVITNKIQKNLSKIYIFSSVVVIKC